MAAKRRKPHKRWTHEEDDRLIQMADVDNLKHKVIADRLKRSLAAIEQRLRTVRCFVPVYYKEPPPALRDLPPRGESPYTIWIAAMGRIK